MNYQEPLNTSLVDLNKIVYPKTKNGGTKKLILIKYNDKSKLKNFVFQTPTLLNLFKPELNGNYANIEFDLVGKEKNKVNNFKKFLNDLEHKIKIDAQYYGANWFNLENENQTINFQKIIRESDKHLEGTLKLKIIKNNDFETVLQLNNNKRIRIEDIPEDSWCKMILECYGIWINSNNDFGIFFRPILISFTPKEKDIYNYKFMDDSDEDKYEDNDVDIPDTEVNQNIFMKIDSFNDKQKQLTDSTSQLEYYNIIKELESSDNKKPDSSSKDFIEKMDDLLDINSDSESNFELNEISNYKKESTSSNIDAETSDN